MSSESTESRVNRERDTRPTPTDAIERQLRTALDTAADEETRFHLRQALQLVAALDEQ